MTAKIGDVGTLRELGVKLGDVVQFTRYLQDAKHRVYGRFNGKEHRDIYGRIMVEEPYWKLISRANPEPKLWKDMTPEEKGALLLAAHEGKVIEWWFSDTWPRAANLKWPLNPQDHFKYRVKPEPKRETVTIGSSDVSWGYLIEALRDHRITFDTVDGKPDRNSIKMEEL